MRTHWIAFAVLAASALFAQSATAAMYKWVDEKGVTHYGDSIPPQYANKAGPMKKTTATAPQTDAAKKPVDAVAGEQDPEKQKAETKRQVDRQRQDTALLATYTSEAEIEAAREREQRRHQDTMKMATAGLAKSKTPEDKRKLDSLLAQGQQEADAINVKFNAHKARFRELSGPPAVAQAPAAKP